MCVCVGHSCLLLILGLAHCHNHQSEGEGGFIGYRIHPELPHWSLASGNYCQLISPGQNHHMSPYIMKCDVVSMSFCHLGVNRFGTGLPINSHFAIDVLSHHFIDRKLYIYSGL